MGDKMALRCRAKACPAPVGAISHCYDKFSVYTNVTESYTKHLSGASLCGAHHAIAEMELIKLSFVMGFLVFRE